MKKVLAFTLALFCGESMADYSPYSTYAGFEVGQATTGFSVPDGASTKFKNLFLHAYMGFNLCDYLALEFGAFTTQSLNASRDDRLGQAKFHGAHAGYIFPITVPLMSQLELLPGASLCVVKTDFYKGNIFKANSVEVVPRFTMAAQYALSDTIKLKATFGWYALNCFASSNSICLHDSIKVGVGMNYSFGAK